MYFLIARFGPPLVVLFLTAPILFGLAGTVVPAFGHLPGLDGGAFTTTFFADLFAQPGIARSVIVSIAAGLVTTAVSLAAVFLFVAAYAGTPIFSRLQHLVSPLLAVPHAAAAFALAFLIAPSGLLARLVSPELTGWSRPPDLLIVHDSAGLTMMAGLIAKEIPFLFLMTLAALPQVDLARSRMLAASFGYGRIAGFACTTWPALYPQIRLAVFAVIAFSSSVVDVAAILGPTTPSPLAVRLVEWMRDPDLASRHLASAGALLQLALTALALLLWVAGEKLGVGLRTVATTAGIRFRHDRLLARAALLFMAVTAGTLGAGLAALAAWSIAGPWQFPDFLPSSITAGTWQEALPRIARPLATTFIVALASSLIATLLAILWLLDERRQDTWAERLTAIVYLPLLVPQAAFLFGLQYLFILFGADATLAALVLVHLLFVLPYVFLSLRDPWRSFENRYETIATGLGKGRWTILFRIRLPMLLRAILTAGAVGFAVSVGQYLPTVLVGAGRLETITTEAVALASGGDRRIIGVYGVLQMVLPMAGFLIATTVPALLLRSRNAMRA